MAMKEGGGEGGGVPDPSPSHTSSGPAACRPTPEFSPRFNCESRTYKYFFLRRWVRAPVYGGGEGVVPLRRLLRYPRAWGPLVP